MNAAFNTLEGTTILGSGTLDVSGIAFTNAGIVIPGTSPGTLTITGNFPQATTGVINIELGGTAAGTEYDVLAISGDATFAGTLNVSLIDPFVPGEGDSFEIITYGSRTGEFDTVNLPLPDRRVGVASDIRPQRHDHNGLDPRHDTAPICYGSNRCRHNRNNRHHPMANR